MKLRTKTSILISLSILMTGFVFAQQKDVEGSKDHPLVSRMENYYISGYEEFEYESHDFYDAEDNEYVIEGHKWVIEYTLKGGFTSPGQLKVRRNYINAIKEIGGTILFDQGLYMKVAKENKETWIEVWVSSDSRDYTLTIVERTIMEQEVAADPDALAGDIKASGRAKVYGIYFDLDSHNIKPESEPTLQAIADMLNANNSLKIYVVGHTDMTGQLDYNMELSLRRAESVVDALVNTHGIAADRIKAQGAGPLCPVSTNNTEEGRKLNRRVELVEMR